jgi:hypothetical protein
LIHTISDRTLVSLTQLSAAANGPFTIYFFLALSGEVTTDPAQHSQSPHLAGLNHIFAAPREICDNCGDQEAAGQLASDTSPITPLLLDYLDLPDNGLESLRPEHVKPFLVKYLRWRVVYASFPIADSIFCYVQIPIEISQPRPNLYLNNRFLYQLIKTLLTIYSILQHGTVSKDPKEVPGLRINVSAKVYHDDGTKTYEAYPDVIEDILQNASAIAAV